MRKNVANVVYHKKFTNFMLISPNFEVKYYRLIIATLYQKTFVSTVDDYYDFELSSTLVIGETRSK
jgi:hypothetical protein